VNDLLFADVGRTDFESVSRFLALFASNTDRALAEIARTESEGPPPTKNRKRN
jgi:hypothetical protein